ncbi:hypothetical protein C5167_005243 [Papaver somniferum]|uniref:Zinc finger PHD-type domain-containing protein n=1 Tax=Papaver somniferum TaxID=3469 RepID=A0A4Y7JAU9_PAPSO|nr:hypothetical protein C5167_005243 [Papaver somniferum]
MEKKNPNTIKIKNNNKKRKVNDVNKKSYGFHTFGDPGCPCDFSGTFRDNIREFMQKCCEIEDWSVEGCPVWCTLLVDERRRNVGVGGGDGDGGGGDGGGGVVVPLYTIEESVKHSLQPFCDQCRCIGWSHHFVSKRRYHLIIPVENDWHKFPDKSLFDDHQTHLLHGLIHCNGFGHLLSINGFEGGSKFFCGREIMDLWDRICTALRARKITVEDVSKKRSMDLRLLYGVAYGHPWFGRWGYQFCHGSFGVTEHNYNTAIDMLSSFNLDKIVENFRGKDRNHMEKIIRTYREMSETHLITIRDLIHVIVDALKEKGSGMSRQDLREAARLHIGDTGLLDFVLKSINNLIVGKYVVLRAMNLETRMLEFTIHELLGEDACETPESSPDGPVAARHTTTSTTTTTTTTTATTTTTHITHDTPGLDVYSDVLYLYKELLLQGYDGKTITELSQLSTQAVLDSKHFVKEWPLRDEEDFFLRFVCRLKPSLFEYGYEYKLNQSCSPPPGELVVVPIHTTIGELKTEIESTLRDTYCLLESFRVTEIEGMEEFEDEEVLFGVVESGADLWVLGNGLGEGSSDALKYEGGVDSWTVDCSCGAKDDDGERMVACDICEVWQHTRCSGIADADAVPRLFLCANCNASLVPSNEHYYMDMEPEGMLEQVYGMEPEAESMLRQVYSMEPESMLGQVYSSGY